MYSLKNKFDTNNISSGGRIQNMYNQKCHQTTNVCGPLISPTRLDHDVLEMHHTSKLP